VTPSIALYIHVPFCERKCTYCDFNSYAGLDDLMPAYTEALANEIRLWGSVERYRVRTVFFGGGTPSELPLTNLARILAAVREAFNVEPGAEVTLEANPGTVDEAYLRGLRDLGVNRLSLGVQSFDDAELQALTRIHSAAEAREAFAAARAAGFERINLDLIYGLPHQSFERWRANVDEAIRLRPEHVSCYALSVEPGTVLFKQVRAGRTPGPDPDLQADMYEYAVEALAAAGYERYEISNWALPGEVCRHNLVYWHNEPYLGVGCGAHSYLHERRFNVVNPPRAYVKALAQAGPGDPWSFPQLESIEPIEPAGRLAETLMLGLRLDEGIRRSALGPDLASLLLAYEPVFAELRDLDLLADDGDLLVLTPRGVLLGNEVFERILVPA
jgi:oxygen-independent coproporphyrinogen-3 oxidase